MADTPAVAGIPRILADLRRRKVVQWSLAYVAAGWGLLQGIGYVGDAFDWPDQVQRVAIVVFTIGLPIATVVAWYHGDRGQQRVGATESAILAALLLAGAGLAWWFGQAPARSTGEDARTSTSATSVAGVIPARSIAVLPFANLSADPEQQYFANGIAEEILNLLARIPELRVISRNSAFAYAGRNVALDEIARELKISHVLEGSVRRSGDRIRITTQLIDARTDTHLWSETYDRTLDDVFAVQDDIAGHVVSQLELKLLGAMPRARRVAPHAYLSYVQARQMLEKDEDGAAINALLQRALQIEPGYADAWTAVSWLYETCKLKNAYAQEFDLPQGQRDSFCARFDDAEAERLSQEALANAVKIDPDNATAVAYQAIRASWAGDLQTAARGFERALRLDGTNVDVLRPVMFFANGIRRPDVTIRLGEYVIDRDPGCTICLDQLARAYEVERRFDDAEATIRVIAEQSPHILARILLQDGRAQAALDIVRAAGFVKSADDQAWQLHLESMALHSLGRESESQASLARLEADFGDLLPLLVAVTRAWRGDLGGAATWLERYLAAPGAKPDPRQLAIPILQPVLELPRMRELLRSRGLDPAQLADLEFRPRLPDGA